MSTGKWALVIVGVLFILAGIVMALQGANYIGGSTLMSGNATYIYLGGAVATMGLVLLALGFRGKGTSAAMGTVQQPTN